MWSPEYVGTTPRWVALSTETRLVSLTSKQKQKQNRSIKIEQVSQMNKYIQDRVPYSLFVSE